ncbi:MAG: hypothetical protein LBT41_03045 [Candidatus Methanoplasma sp.]|jgi:hypothetical protein|nr:hypothetical protein [Candidatus Methanoplasma sp.]
MPWTKCDDTSKKRVLITGAATVSLMILTVMAVAYICNETSVDSRWTIMAMTVALLLILVVLRFVQDSYSDKLYGYGSEEKFRINMAKDLIGEEK